jgi:hypothetical protein
MVERGRFLVAALLTFTSGVAASAERISVKHIQLPRHEFMVARSETGKIVARVEFTEDVQGDEVTMRLTYRFLDGSIDDETTTYRQRCDGSRNRYSDQSLSGQERQYTR